MTTCRSISTILLSIVLVLASLIQCHANIHSIKLHGVIDRASYDSLKDLALSYKLIEPDLAFTLTASTSTESIAAMTDKDANFATSLSGWSNSIAATAPDLWMQPLFLTGFVPVYRLDKLGSNAPSIIFTREILVRIFTGDIVRWDDPMLVTANPLSTLPAQNITVVFERGGDARKGMIKNALYQFNETAMLNFGMLRSNENDYPTERYSVPAVQVEAGVTSLVTGVVATDGSFAIASQSVASVLGVSIGWMVNKAGKTVQFTDDSITFAAIEKAIAPTGTRTTAHVLTDPESETAWPLRYDVIWKS